MKKSNFALRLQPSLMEEAKKVAKAEGVAVNQLINVAVAEKVSALRTEDYFAERAAKGDIKDPYGTLMEKAGQVRDGGAFWERMGKVACWNTLMDENRYMVRKWNEFVSA